MMDGCVVGCMDWWVIITNIIITTIIITIIIITTTITITTIRSHFGSRSSCLRAALGVAKEAAQASASAVVLPSPLPPGGSHARVLVAPVPIHPCSPPLRAGAMAPAPWADAGAQPLAGDQAKPRKHRYVVCNGSARAPCPVSGWAWERTAARTPWCKCGARLPWPQPQPLWVAPQASGGGSSAGGGVRGMYDQAKEKGDAGALEVFTHTGPMHAHLMMLANKNALMQYTPRPCATWRQPRRNTTTA